MSGEPIGESFRELIELAAQENRRSNRLSKAAYAGFFGAFALGLTGGFFYSLSAGIGWGFWVAAAGALAASIFSAALNSRHHKKCAVTSRALIEKSQDQIDPNTIEPLQEGEFMGAYETLCCDESMVMMSRNRSFAVDIVIRIGSLLISIAAFGIIAAGHFAIGFVVDQHAAETAGHCLHHQGLVFDLDAIAGGDLGTDLLCLAGAVW